MEKVSTLQDLVKSNKIKIDNTSIKEIFFTLSKYLIALHSNNFFHSDIKPQNIFVNENAKNFKKYFLSDFGAAMNYKNSEKKDSITYKEITEYS